MKGALKAMKRTPHMVTSKIGMSKKSSDPEFEDYHRKFQALESATENLLKDSKKFTENLALMLSSGTQWATHFATLFNPISGEFDLIGKNPEAANTIRNVEALINTSSELHDALRPEIELIETRIVMPVRDLQGILKTIRKNVTKREHKLVDYDRHNNSLTKLRDKKEKSLNDEKNLFKLEQDFEHATNEYDAINIAMKTELPQFLVLATQFIDPLFHSFYYMQLNIYYTMMEKLQSFAEGRYDVTNIPGSQIAQIYEDNRSDAWQTIEELNSVRRIVSTAKMMQTRQGSGSSFSRAPSTASSFAKKGPPPPPGAGGIRSPPPSAAPPPYSPGRGAGPATAAAVGAKRAPPPPPPLKPKPAAKPAVQYVVALYDFDAQADGDLSFAAGDRIELVERTPNQEDWWTGRVNGRQGVFPGNYVQDS